MHLLPVYAVLGVRTLCQAINYSFNVIREKNEKDRVPVPCTMQFPSCRDTGQCRHNVDC